MEIAYLIDTDWVIDHFNSIKKVNRKLKELKPQGLGLSIISLAELYEGVYFSRDPQKSEDILLTFLTGVQLIGIDEDICKVFARERGRLRKQGKIIGDFDLLIASTCLHYNFSVLTNNRKHFEMVEGLNIISA